MYGWEGSTLKDLPSFFKKLNRNNFFKKLDRTNHSFIICPLTFVERFDTFIAKKDFLFTKIL